MATDNAVLLLFKYQAIGEFLNGKTFDTKAKAFDLGFSLCSSVIYGDNH